MIDGNFKSLLDRLWERLGALPAALGITPNQVTWSGLALMALACLAYQIWPHPAWFALAIAAIFAFDSLDGAVARLTGLSSSYGGYLDAMVDRYQEAFVLAALANVHGCWAAAFFALSGSMLVSYAKARTAIEIPIDNVKWPDLMERLERVIFLVASLLLAAIIPWGNFIPAMLWVLALLTHGTALQRFLRARRMLKE